MKKWKFYYAVACLTSLPFASCEDETTITFDSTSQRKIETVNYKALFSESHAIPWNEALEIAEQAARLYFDDEGNGNLKNARLPRNPSIGGFIVAEKGSSLKSSDYNIDDDTLAYICNYADSAGFAIICADNRVGCPILACCDYGTLHDTIENEGLAIFLENLQPFIEARIDSFEATKDSLLQNIGFADFETIANNHLKSKTTGTFTLSKGLQEVKPLLHTRWAQSGNPYNTLTRTCSNQTGNVPAGCWSVAISQIMAYYKHPNYIQYYDPIRKQNVTTTLHWNSITESYNAYSLSNEYQTEVSRLLYGNGLKIDTDYGCDGSSASEDKAMRYMKEIGYKSCTSEKYNNSLVLDLLNARRPVLMNGKSKRKKKLFGLINKYSGGHAWIVDGYNATVMEDYSYVADLNAGSVETKLLKTYLSDIYLHVNWGWGGIYNGYFDAGCFDISKAKNYDTSSGRETTNYQYQQGIFIVWR